MANLNNLHSIKRKRSKKDKNLLNSNIKYVALIVSFFALILLIQIFRWQILFAERFQNMGEDQYKSNKVQVATRGIITAADGTVLAVDEPVWNVYASLSMDPRERKLFFENKDKFVTEVSSILNIEKVEIEDKLDEDFMYVLLKKDVSTEKKKALEEIKICREQVKGFGLYFEYEEKRVYPNNQLAAHVLGFIGKDSNDNPIGQYGIQGFYYGDITGRQGYSYEEKDSAGNIILTAEYEPVLPREGKNFKLTIIPNIQSKTEDILEKAVKDSRAKSGTVIIMDPKTGAILAMANYPTFDPNEYWRISEPWILKNRAIADVYEYGSVQKPITVAIALESEAIKKDHICNDTKGYLDLYEATGYPDLKGERVHTWNRRASGQIDIPQIFAQSNNPCTALIGLETSFSYFYSSLRDFGVGEFIGIGLQEESTSYLRPQNLWTRLDVITASYGQGISATPLQLISALSTFANEGVRMKPYIISEISDEKDTIKIKPQVASKPISRETANYIKEALETGVQKHNLLSAYGIPLLEYDIVAKTGTAQLVKDDGTYDEYVSNDTVVGFAPANNPKMIMLVKLQEPKTAGFASLTTVPIWRDIFFAIADDMEITKRN